MIVSMAWDEDRGARTEFGPGQKPGGGARSALDARQSAPKHLAAAERVPFAEGERRGAGLAARTGRNRHAPAASRRPKAPVAGKAVSAARAIASHPALLLVLKMQSQALFQAYQQNPRVSSTFATQQRWLLAHIGLSLHFERADGAVGMTTAQFLERVRQHRVASRNTADAFIKEMQKYGIIVQLPGGDDRRIRPMEPGAAAIDALHAWTAAHLRTLDSLDGGGRAERFLSEPAALARLQPRIADGLLRTKAIREPVQTV
jgi:hypothetical protein